MLQGDLSYHSLIPVKVLQLLQLNYIQGDSVIKIIFCFLSQEMTQGDGQLIEKEEMVRGSVSYKTYLYLMGNIGWGLILIIAVVVALQSTLSVVTNFWLSDWTEAGLSNEVRGTYFHQKLSETNVLFYFAQAILFLVHENHCFDFFKI